jgi:Zn-finger nucleic acid-binding protein
MDCPRDGTVLGATNYEGFEVDKCGACGGVWLDAGELEAIQNKADHAHHAHRSEKVPDQVQRAINEVAQLEAKPIKCPKCGDTMVARDYGLGAQIVIDTCPRDCGVWLDVGEIQELEKFYEESHQDALDVLPLGLWLRIKLADLRAKLS